MNDYTEIKLITKQTEINKKLWLYFVKNHPKGNIFQTQELFNTYLNSKNFLPFWVVAINKKEEIKGLVVGRIERNYFWPISIFTSRAIINGGPLIENNNSEILDLLLSNLSKTLKHKAIYIEFRNMWNWELHKNIFNKNGFKYEPHLDILIDLERSQDKIISNISKNKRGNVNKSRNKGTEFIEISNKKEIDKSIDLIRKTYNRINLPSPSKDFFIEAFDNLHSKGILKVFSAFFENKQIGTRWELCYNKVIYDWYAGSDNNYKNKYPNDFLPFNIILWGNKNNYRTFDFGGAGKPNIPYGVRVHKLRFGGELVEYGRFSKTNFKIIMKSAEIILKFWRK